MGINKISVGGIAVALTSFLPPFAGGTEKERPQTPPNIILIMTDQQTAGAMSAAGCKDLSTPNMDRLAAAGVVFKNAYCTAPLSGPSRAAMFTGCYPDEIGMIRNGAEINNSLATKTLGNIMKESGYECAYAGKWHVNESSIPDGKYGFRRIHEHKDTGLAEACTAFLRSPHDRPFFLVASFDNPHNICEYAREQNLPWGNIEIPESATLPGLPDNFKRNEDDADVILNERQNNYSAYPTIRYTENDWRRYRYAYFRLVEKVDAEIGKIIDEIDELRLWKNTVVIFTSDHGDGVGAHNWNQKSALYEEVVNIPLIVTLPGKKSAGKTVESLVSNGIDFFATVCDIAGIEADRHKPGRSFLPLAEGKTNSGHDYIVCETTFDNGKARGWMLRTKSYKYVLYNTGKNREQLFDMDSDKGETCNLAGDKGHIETLQHHRDLLEVWMKDNDVRPSRPIIHDIPGKTLD